MSILNNNNIIYINNIIDDINNKINIIELLIEKNNTLNINLIEKLKIENINLLDMLKKILLEYFPN